MQSALKIHPTQAKIVNTLLFKIHLPFNKLNTESIPSDKFNFHLKALVHSGLAYKADNSEYYLTTHGKEFAGRFDTDKAILEKQAKICVVIYCSQVEQGITKYLLQQRLKQPYYGYYGPPGGKVRWGETTSEAAIREMAEETGLEVTVTTMCIKHKMDYLADGTLAEDKYFIVFRAQIVGGKFVTDIPGGRNAWFTKSEIIHLSPVFDDFDRTMAAVHQKTLTFAEHKYTVSGF